MTGIHQEAGWIALAAMFAAQALAGGAVAVRLGPGRVVPRRPGWPVGPGLGVVAVGVAWVGLIRTAGAQSAWNLTLFALVAGIGYFLAVTVDHATDPRTSALPLHSALIAGYRLGGVLVVGAVLAARA